MARNRGLARGDLDEPKEVVVAEDEAPFECLAISPSTMDDLYEELYLDQKTDRGFFGMFKSVDESEKSGKLRIDAKPQTTIGHIFFDDPEYALECF